jgi:pimeloyl-ACP methyl ester carboxylesterase
MEAVAVAWHARPAMLPMRPSLAAVLLIAATGCTYLGSMRRQAVYAHAAERDPQQRIYKHMLDRDTFFVFGELLGAPDRDRAPMAVVAVSDAFRAGEVVDVNHCSRKDSFYGLNLPAGEYRLLVVRDANGDGFYDEREVVGVRTLSLAIETAPERVVGGYDIDLRAPPAAEVPGLRVKTHPSEELAESLFFPRGTIRSLDDDVFSPEMASLGMYEPAAFLERAPMMFYALEENYQQKVPVIFVHGIGGSAREFADVVAHLDRRRYRPWFFYYPSGSSLSQLSEMFYRIFLSGDVIKRQSSPFVIVAHSMGGLVVRDALNRCTGSNKENPVARLITVASPLGGHPGAAAAERAPMVLPSWRDLNPSSPFIRALHRRPLPAGLEYHLLYTFGNPSAVKFGENSDGVVPLSAQLPPVAQAEAKAQFGFDATHTGVLHDPLAIAHLVKLIEEVKSAYPEDHLREMDRGGYRIPPGSGYTPLEAFVIHEYGYYLDALAMGRIAPCDEVTAHLVAVLQGRSRPRPPIETAWLKFAKEYPDRSVLDAAAAEGKRAAGGD